MDTDDPHLRGWYSRPKVRQQVSQLHLRRAIAKEEADPWTRALARLGASLYREPLSLQRRAEMKALCGCGPSASCAFCVSQLGNDAVMASPSVRAAAHAAGASRDALSASMRRTSRIGSDDEAAADVSAAPRRPLSARPAPHPPHAQPSRRPALANRQVFDETVKQIIAERKAADAAKAEEAKKQRMASARRRRSPPAATTAQRSASQQQRVQRRPRTARYARHAPASLPAVIEVDTESITPSRTLSPVRSRTVTPTPAAEPVVVQTGRDFRAARTIQAWFLGVALRHNLGIRRAAATKIQRLFRDVLRARAVLIACGRLQRFGRGMKIRIRACHIRARHKIDAAASAFLAEERARFEDLVADEGTFFVERLFTVCEEDQARDELLREEFDRRRAAAIDELVVREEVAHGVLLNDCDAAFSDKHRRKTTVTNIAAELVRVERRERTNRDNAWRECDAAHHRGWFRYLDESLRVVEEPLARADVEAEEVAERLRFIWAAAEAFAAAFPSQALRELEYRSRRMVIAEYDIGTVTLRNEYSRLRLAHMAFREAHVTGALEASERATLARKFARGPPRR